MEGNIFSLFRVFGGCHHKYEKRQIICMKLHLFLLTSMLCCLLIATPVAAVVDELLWKGQIVGIDYETSSITVEITELYECEDIELAMPTCGIEDIGLQQMSAESPIPAAYDVISVGDISRGQSHWNKLWRTSKH
jgi:hypothetical protein